MNYMQPTYSLFSWEHSYFSGKVRAYLRYKRFYDDLGPGGYEDILATPELQLGLLEPATGTRAVPQVKTSDGRWLQDSSEIIDTVEAAHRKMPVVPERDRPKQRLASYLVELLADEWMLVYAFWQRWHYSLETSEPNQLAFNAQQWGAFLSPQLNGPQRRRAAEEYFRTRMSLHEPDKATVGPISGLLDLGVDENTQPHWEASYHRIMGVLEQHFGHHDFVLGGRPSLGDFSLLGPLYAHMFRDAVPGYEMRLRYPLVAEWVERTNGVNALNARSYGQKLYGLDENRELVEHVACTDNGEWLPEDTIPDTLLPLLDVFFEEMWPCLQASVQALRAFLDGTHHKAGSELPGKSFFSTPGFEILQRDGGHLTHAFRLGDARGTRMVVPYHVWMLQRIEVSAELGQRIDGYGIENLSELIAGCRVRKHGGRLFEDAKANGRE